MMRIPPDRIDFVNRVLAENDARLDLLDEDSGAYRLMVGGAIQSQISMVAPASLGVDYLRVIERAIVDFIPTGREFQALHLGIGAGCLARALATRYPRSRHVMVDAAPDVCEPVLRALPLPCYLRGEIVYEDARRALSLPVVKDVAPFDLAVIDLWAGDRVEPHVTTREFYRAVDGLLWDTALLVVNLPDTPGCAFTRSQAAALRQIFPDVHAAVHRCVLHGEGPGNAVLIAARHLHAARDEYLDHPSSWIQRDEDTFEILHGPEFDAWGGDAEAAGDATATGSPRL